MGYMHGMYVRFSVHRYLERRTCKVKNDSLNIRLSLVAAAYHLVPVLQTE